MGSSADVEQIAALGALIVACCGVALTAFALRRKTDDDYTHRLERQIAALQRELEEQKGEQINMLRDLEVCKEARSEFQKQNSELMWKLLRLEERGQG